MSANTAPQNGADSAFAWARLRAELGRLLAGPLPGGRAQNLLAPRPRDGWQPDRIPDDCRPGAALLMLYPRDDRAHIVLTVRDGGLPLHAGQVSLPGGAVEPGESVDEAALREAEEEIGLAPSRVRVVGHLSPLHIPVSGFVLHPVVGLTDDRPELRPQEGEVARILDVSLDTLLDPASARVEQRRYKGRVYDVPYLAVEGEKLWGATAMILAELLVVLGCPPRIWNDDPTG